MLRIITSILFVCVGYGLALADEKPVSYRIITTASQFNATDNTYTFEVRFVADPCPDVHYNIPFYPSGVKDSDDAIAKVKPQLDKIAADLARDEEKRCHH